MEKTTTVEKVGVYISVSKLPTTVGQTVQLIKYIRNDGDSSKRTEILGELIKIELSYINNSN